MTITSKTGMTLTEFYASNTGTNDWEEDILGCGILDNGETFEINIDDGTGTCRSDFRAVFENGGDSIKNKISVFRHQKFESRIRIVKHPDIQSAPLIAARSNHGNCLPNEGSSDHVLE